jgi:hypothetical protein
MKPSDESESPAEDVVDHLAVIYCTLCGNRSMHATDGGKVTMTWRMTPRELRMMRRELAKTRCIYCDGSIDIRVLGRHSV